MPFASCVSTFWTSRWPRRAETEPATQTTWRFRADRVRCPGYAARIPANTFTSTLTGMPPSRLPSKQQRATASTGTGTSSWPKCRAPHTLGRQLAVCNTISIRTAVPVDRFAVSIMVLCLAQMSIQSEYRARDSWLICTTAFAYGQAQTSAPSSTRYRAVIRMRSQWMETWALSIPLYWAPVCWRAKTVPRTTLSSRIRRKAAASSPRAQTGSVALDSTTRPVSSFIIFVNY